MNDNYGLFSLEKEEYAFKKFVKKGPLIMIQNLVRNSRYAVALK